MTKPLTREDADNMARAAQDLAARLGRAVGVIGTAHDYGYPSTGSTAPAEPSNQTDEDGQPVQPSSRPEALAIRADLQAKNADAVANEVRRITARIESLDTIVYFAWDPERTVKVCVVCGHPYERGSTRCRQIIDGKQCGASENADRFCAPVADGGCGEKQLPGRPLRNGKCDACRKRDERASKAAERGTGTIDVTDTAGMIVGGDS